MNNIYIVGFMGTGKTTVARELARQKAQECIDMDQLLEERQKRSIPDIFAQEGEPYFRKIEQELLKEISGHNNCIVSCGGGVIIDPQNIALMKDTGIIVCLSASPEVILKRTSQASNRPLLNVAKPLDRIKFLLSCRRSAYEQSHLIINTSDLNIEQVVQEILKNIC